MATSLGFCHLFPRSDERDLIWNDLTHTHSLSDFYPPRRDSGGTSITPSNSVDLTELFFITNGTFLQPLHVIQRLHTLTIASLTASHSQPENESYHWRCAISSRQNLQIGQFPWDASEESRRVETDISNHSKARSSN